MSAANNLRIIAILTFLVLTISTSNDGHKRRSHNIDVSTVCKRCNPDPDNVPVRKTKHTKLASIITKHAKKHYTDFDKAYCRDALRAIHGSVMIMDQLNQIFKPDVQNKEEFEALVKNIHNLCDGDINLEGFNVSMNEVIPLAEVDVLGKVDDLSSTEFYIEKFINDIFLPKNANTEMSVKTFLMKRLSGNSN